MTPQLVLEINLSYYRGANRESREWTTWKRFIHWWHLPLLECFCQLYHQESYPRQNACGLSLSEWWIERRNIHWSSTWAVERIPCKGSLPAYQSRIALEQASWKFYSKIGAYVVGNLRMHWNNAMNIFSLVRTTAEYWLLFYIQTIYWSHRNGNRQ